MEPAVAAFIQRRYQKLDPDLPQEFLDAIAQCYKPRMVEKGSFLYTPGSICNHLGMVFKGIFRMYHQVEGREYTYEFYEEGQVVGDYISFISRQPGQSWIQALEDATIFEISYEDVEAMYLRFPLFYRLATENLNRVYIRNFEKYSSVLLDDLKTRYLQFLEKRASVASRVPQYMIASYLGVSPEALTRVRRSLGM